MELHLKILRCEGADISRVYRNSDFKKTKQKKTKRYT